MEKSGTVPATPGQMKDIISAVIQQVPVGLTFKGAKKVIGSKKGLKEIRSLILKIAEENEGEEMVAEFQRFYKEVLGVETDFSDLVLPSNQDGFDWLLIMLKGLTADGLYVKCKERFGAWRYCEDFSKVTSIRKTDHTYAIRLRDRIEADEENKNKSVNQCKKEEIDSITLEERLLLELWYHWKTGQHLDIGNWTLCTGSRYSVGNVPLVHWHVDKMFVYYYHPFLFLRLLRRFAGSLRSFFKKAAGGSLIPET